MGPMHLFRTTLLALADKKLFAGSGAAMQRIQLPGVKAPPPPPKAFRLAGAPAGVFLDPSGWHNLLNRVSKAALTQARDCANRTAKLLASSAGPDTFDAVFLTQHGLGELYDLWYRVKVPENIAAELFDQDVTSWQEMDRRVAEVAEKALGTRATLVRTYHRATAAPEAAGAVKKAYKKSGAAGAPVRKEVLLAARLDPTAALRSVDIGPPADSGAPAAEFRAFWGEKSELRRFQDGKICEAVVWEGAAADRHLIVDALLQHALTRHLPAGTEIVATCGALDGAICRKGSTPDGDLEAARLCEAAAGRLGKRLRTLDGLTLRVVATQPLAPVLRHADAFPPLPHELAGAPQDSLAKTRSDHGEGRVPRCLPAVELLCQLEGSGRWPDGPAAFAKMKAALGVQLADTLHSGFGIPASAAEDYVDVLYDGFAFRLVLHTERDGAMQKMLLTAHGMAHPPPDDDIALRVWHQGTISAVAAANPAFEPSVRLAKRWVASQWLSPHLREEAVELLVAAAFTSGAGVAAPPPASRLTGLLRFLRLVGDHPWAAQPLVADVSTGDPGPSRREAAARAHAAQRAAGTAPALFMTGPSDDECVGWTRDAPSRPMLHRAAVLARKAAAVLESLLAGEGDEDAAMAAVFAHDESEYEVLIRLRPDALPRSGEALKVKAKKRKAAGEREVLEPQLSAAEAKLCRAVLKGIPKSTSREEYLSKKPTFFPF